MKKIFAFAIAFLSVTALFAQSRNNRYDRNYNESGNVVSGRDYSSHKYNGYSSHNDNGYSSHNEVYNYPNQRNNDRYNDQRKREEMDRINSDYNRRINDYRNDRSINAYERDRRIREAENERSEKLRSFAGGAVVGAVAGVLLGMVLSH
jgi:hypothetical protein